MAARPSGRNSVLDAITVSILTRLAGSMAMTQRPFCGVAVSDY
jgi:hypothetical protein